MKPIIIGLALLVVGLPGCAFFAGKEPARPEAIALAEGWKVSYIESRPERPERTLEIEEAGEGTPIGASQVLPKAVARISDVPPLNLYWAGGFNVAMDLLNDQGRPMGTGWLQPERTALTTIQLLWLPSSLLEPAAARALPSNLPLLAWQEQMAEDAHSREIEFVAKDINTGETWRAHYFLDASPWPSRVEVHLECDALCPHMPYPESVWTRIGNNPGEGAPWKTPAALPGQLAPLPSESGENFPPLDPGSITVDLASAISRSEQLSSQVRSYLSENHGWRVESATFQGSSRDGTTEWKVDVASPSSDNRVSFRYTADAGDVSAALGLDQTQLSEPLGRAMASWETRAKVPTGELPWPVTSCEPRQWRLSSIHFSLGDMVFSANKSNPNPTSGSVSYVRDGIAANCPSVTQSLLFGLKGSSLLAFSENELPF